MSQLKFEGHSYVQINEIRINSLVSNKTIDITRLVDKLNIYESLFDPTIIGEIHLTDPTGLLYDLPLLGEEFLFISFNSPKAKPFEKTFWVHKVPHVERDSSMQKHHLTLSFSSIEQLRGITTMIDRGFRGTLSNAVKDIFDRDLKTSKKLVVEQTKGVETIIIPTWNIFDTIEFIRHRAVSDKYHSPYVFFEDHDAFNFMSIEYLIDIKRSANNIVKFTSVPFSPEAGENSAKSTLLSNQYRNVENFHITKKSDTASLINSGGLSSRTQIFDLFEKKMKNVDMDYKEFANNVVKRPIDDKYNSQHSDMLAGMIDVPIIRYTIGYDKYNPSAYHENFNKRTMFAKQLNDISVSFICYGDSELNVGDVIYIQIPRVSQAPNDDSQLTGNYIISRLQHTIDDTNLFTTVEANRLGHAEKVT